MADAIAPIVAAGRYHRPSAIIAAQRITMKRIRALRRRPIRMPRSLVPSQVSAQSSATSCAFRAEHPVIGFNPRRRAP